MSEYLENQDLDAEAAALEGEFGPAPEIAQQQAEEHAQTQQRESAAKEWAGLFELVLNPAAQVLAPNWGITGDEIKMLSDAYGECAAEYLPEVGEAGPWVGALLVTGMVAAPRLGTPRKLPPKKEQDDEGANDAG